MHAALQSAIFSSENFSSIATDANGVIQIFNVGAERMLGYAAADVVNTITPADISDPLEVVARAALLSAELGTTIAPGFEALVFKASRGIEDIYELTYIRKDGTRLPAIVSVTALRDPQNAIIGYLLIGTDNTARRRAEEDLLQAGALQNAIFNSANFSSIATDAKGVIQIFNVGAERMLGYSAVEVVDQITPADISDPLEVVARAETLSAELGTSIAPGFEALVFKASRGIEDIYELTYIRKDGSRFPAVVSVTALRDAQSAIIGYLLIGTDNTARKRVEAEQRVLDQRLRDQQFYTRSLIESNIDALITTDPSGVITDANRQMEVLTGCTRDELIGSLFRDFFTDPARATAGIRLVLAGSKVTDYELTARSRSGAETVVSYNATTFYDRDRTLQGVFASARDITERKRIDRVLEEKNVELEKARATAERASHSKSEFLSSMSHELRTPLIGVTGMLEVLVHSDLNAEQRGVVDIIQESAESLLHIIGDILDFSKIEANKMELALQTMSVRSLMKSLAQTFKSVAAVKGLDFVVEVDPRVAPAHVADALRIRQVLNNLMSNALKFTDSGSITLRLLLLESRRGSEALAFEVQDTGIGVAAEHQAKLFEPFSQAEASTSRRFGGTGLGLNISRRLAEVMGGTLKMSSVVRQGTTMTLVIDLPLGDDREIVSKVHYGTERVPTAAAPSIEEAAAAGRLILLAEDHPTNRIVLTQQVNRAGYALEVAEDGQAAFKKWQTGRFALILTDLHMPNWDGHALTSAVRAAEDARGGARTPIVALTANVEGGEAERCLALGMDAYLTKPVSMTQLAATLLAWMPPATPAGASPVGETGQWIAGVNGGALLESCGGDPVATLRVLADFVAASRADQLVMEAGVLQKDLPCVLRQAHRIRGSSAMVGAYDLSTIVAALEACAKGSAPQWTAISECVALVGAAIDGVDSALAAARDRPTEPESPPRAAA